MFVRAWTATQSTLLGSQLDRSTTATGWSIV
jgi:hypothetical protein